MLSLDDKLIALKGVGPKKQELFSRLHIETVGDLLFDFPLHYEDRSLLRKAGELEDGDRAVLFLRLVKVSRPYYYGKRQSMFTASFADASGPLKVVFHNQPYLARSLQPGRDYWLFGEYQGKKKLMNDPSIHPMDQPRPTDSGLIPLYRLTQGLTQRSRQEAVRQALERADLKQAEVLPPSFVEGDKAGSFRPLGEGLWKLHFPSSSREVEEGWRQLLLREEVVNLLCRRLISLSRQEKRAGQMEEKSLAPFLACLPYQLTASQEEAVREIRKDLLCPWPMNRILAGDVGSGKTVVAFAAAYLALANGYQVALMAPTSILADQHKKKAVPLFSQLGFPVYELTSADTADWHRQLEEKAGGGEVALYIGTHALIQEGLAFQRLGLVITDEQHRFGVKQRASLQEKAVLPHSLVLSATPIPRTMTLIQLGDLDLSRLEGRPSGRLPVKTYVVDESYERRAFHFLARRVEKGEQAFIICPRIEKNEDELDHWSVEKTLKRAVPFFQALGRKTRRELVVAGLHGQMTAEEKEGVMEAFSRHEVDILISTSVVEVGIDVPSATTMLIFAADSFGLAQLHQLRGRVGRGKNQSYCILFAHSPSKASRERLKLLERTDDGYAIAQADLRLRGGGDRLGTLQHGLVDGGGDKALEDRCKKEARDFLRLYGSQWTRLEDIPQPLQQAVRTAYDKYSKISLN